MKPIPPHIGWPLFIVGLLGFSIVGTLITVYAARSDGGAQVVEDYYRKAVEWDERAARQAASDALQWRVEVAVPKQDAPGVVEIRVQDRDGAPVEHLRGTVRAFRPQRAAAVAEAALRAVPGVPGVYRQALPVRQAGLWDFEIVAERDSLRLQTTVRTEVQGK